MNERILIISNNPFSNTDNNGKTLLSFFDSLPKRMVRQLYFSAEKPTVRGYNYFQISDMDIIKGIFRSSMRGRIYNYNDGDMPDSTIASDRSPSKTYHSFARLLREVLWYKRWASQILLNWIDEYSPSVIFFLAGDSVFAYNIAQKITDRCGCRLIVYITDDYFLERNRESLIHKIRRTHLVKKAKKVVQNSHSFITISESMRNTYLDLLGKDSTIAVHMIDNLKKNIEIENDCIELIYAGSFYYNRSKIIGKIGQSIKRYNDARLGKKAFLRIYSNRPPTKKQFEDFHIKDCCEYQGSLSKNELVEKLNLADVTLFVESFDEKHVEKTMLSLSTKVPEYLSVGKAILAIGPKEVSSMKYLYDVAACVTSEDQGALDKVVFDLLSNIEYRNMLGKKAHQKYIDCLTKEKQLPVFMNTILDKN